MTNNNSPTNEELAILAKTGNKDALIQLWNKNKGLLYKTMMRYFETGKRLSFDPEDLMQECYFAIVHTVEAYDPNNWLPFSAYLRFRGRSEIRRALKITTKQTQAELYSIYLDSPLSSEDDTFSLVDTIADESSEQEIHNIIDKVYYEQLHSEIEACFRFVKPREEEILRMRYFNDMTQEAVAKETGATLSYIRRRESQALAKMSKPEITQRLKPFLRFQKWRAS